MSIGTVIFIMASNLVFLIAGAALTYRRQSHRDPAALPDFDLKKAWRMIRGREPTPEESDMIDGKDKPEAGRFDPSKLPNGSPRHHPKVATDGRKHEVGR